MLGRLFPKQMDNTYRGHWLGMWLFVPIVLLELVIGTNSIINTRSVATGADVSRDPIPPGDRDHLTDLRLADRTRHE